MVDPSLAPHPAVARRRDALLNELGDTPALVPAGAAVGRNYPGNPYPFRASSHFLYLVGDGGASLEDTWLFFHDGKATLFAEPPSAEDALWHGPTPGLDALSSYLDIDTHELGHLPRELAGRDVATVPAPDAATRERQRALLGRDPAELTGADEKLRDALIALRLVHDEAAIAGLRQAAEATAAAHRAGMAVTRPGLREWQVMAAMEAALGDRGMTTAYPPIVTVHGEVLHNHAHHHTLEKGDLLLVDVGAETRGGWAGDVTRTWPAAGAYTGPQRDMVEVVLAAQEAAIAEVKPGVRYRDVHLTAAKALCEGLVGLGVLKGDPEALVEDDLYAAFFPHGVGHLIGLDVHDMEDLGDRAGYAPGRERAERFGLSNLRLDRDLEAGMAVTIEPGFYQVPALLHELEHDEGWAKKAKGRVDRERLAAFQGVRGIRIEDDVLVTESGCEVLTAAIPKTPAEVEEAVGG